MARGLFVEPFYGGSHRAFADGLVAHGGHALELLTLPGRAWRRRMRLGAQVLAGRAKLLPTAFDFLLVTDMLDLPTFLALTSLRFAATPVLLFMHENQLTYPRLRGTQLNSWFGQINYLSALAADRVAFNSDYHRDDFVTALERLSQQPNNWLEPAAIETIRTKSTVLPVGVDLGSLANPPAPPATSAVQDGPLILWNHRWEFDKAPEPFVRTMTQLAEEGHAFRLAVLGSRGDNPSAAMLALPERLGDRLVQFGHVESRAEYSRLLWEADLVVSTTRHEFFGVATVEAMFCGCLPLVPHRFNYPALVPAALHERCLYETEAEFLAKVRLALQASDRVQGGGASDAERAALRSSAERFGWEVVGPLWGEALEELAASAAGPPRSA